MDTQELREAKKWLSIFSKLEDEVPRLREARYEAASLKDELEMKQVSNDAIDKEAGELRAEVEELKEALRVARIATVLTSPPAS